jgi:hypothetical protein
MMMIDFEKLVKICWDQYTKWALMFCMYFFMRCMSIHFGWGEVPGPWIIEASWYFPTILGAILAVPLMVILFPWMFEGK